MHATAVYANDRLGKEACGHAHVGRDLAAEQLIELDLVGRPDNFRVAVVDLKLAWSHFRVILLVLKAHGALYFGRSVDELAQRVERERMIVAAAADEFELASLVIS